MKIKITRSFSLKLKDGKEDNVGGELTTFAKGKSFTVDKSIGEKAIKNAWAVEENAKA